MHRSKISFLHFKRKSKCLSLNEIYIQATHLLIHKGKEPDLFYQITFFSAESQAPYAWGLCYLEKSQTKNLQKTPWAFWEQRGATDKVVNEI